MGKPRSLIYLVLVLAFISLVQITLVQNTFSSPPGNVSTSTTSTTSSTSSTSSTIPPVPELEDALLYTDKETYLLNESIGITVLAENLSFDLWIPGAGGWLLALQNYSGSATYIYSSNSPGNYTAKTEFFIMNESKGIFWYIVEMGDEK